MRSNRSWRAAIGNHLRSLIKRNMETTGAGAGQFPPGLRCLLVLQKHIWVTAAAKNTQTSSAEHRDRADISTCGQCQATHTHTHTHTHTQTHAYTRKHTHTHTHTRTDRDTQTHRHTDTQTHRHRQRDTDTQAQTHALTQTLTQTQTQTQTQSTQTQTHTHTDSYIAQATIRYVWSFMFLAKVDTLSLNRACSFSGSRADSYAIGAINDGAEPRGDLYDKDLHAIRSIALWKI